MLNPLVFRAIRTINYRASKDPMKRTKRDYTSGKSVRFLECERQLCLGDSYRCVCGRHNGNESGLFLLSKLQQ
jgi:hypothetical protein